jgi:hypothetical protein
MKEEPIYKKNVYWKQGKSENELDGPYCTRCWDKDKYWIRLKPVKPPHYKCPECKNTYRVEEI